MPATSVELDDEILSLLGKLPQALRAAEKEVAKLEKQIADAARKGEQVSPEKLQRAAELRARAVGYREAVETERRLKALEKQAKALEPSHGNEPPSSEPRKVTKREPLSESVRDWLRNAGGRQRRGLVDMDAEAFGKMRWWMNTHNPHGTIRNVIHGNFGFNNVTSILQKFGVASAVGAAVVAGATGLIGLAKLESERDSENAKITLSNATKRAEIAQTFRWGASQNAVDFLKQIEKSPAVIAKNKMTFAHIEANASVTNSFFGLGRIFQGSQREKVAQYMSEINTFNWKNQKAPLSTDPLAFVNTPQAQFAIYGPGNVRNQLGNTFSKLGKGEILNAGASAIETAGLVYYKVMHWLSNIVPGKKAREELDASMEEGRRRMKGYEKYKEAVAKDFYKLDPQQTVIRKDVENQTAAVRQWQMERFTDWNSY